uniref:Defensin n=1 Tax=Ginkgo biloba TaxID=3311 RepID=Q670N7_GINBI|nr:defensin precursor [Ginkgo biloba]
MARRMGSLSVFLVVLVLVISLEMQAEVAEARTCKTQSSKFKGYCLSDTNCRNVCRTEGFPTGSCDFHVASRKCYCYKPCV